MPDMSSHNHALYAILLVVPEMTIKLYSHVATVRLPLRLTLISPIDVGRGSGGGVSSFPLFGLFELGNTIFYYPDNPNLEGAVGNHNVT